MFCRAIPVLSFRFYPFVFLLPAFFLGILLPVFIPRNKSKKFSSVVAQHFCCFSCEVLFSASLVLSASFCYKIWYFSNTFSLCILLLFAIFLITAVTCCVSLCAFLCCIKVSFCVCVSFFFYTHILLNFRHV